MSGRPRRWPRAFLLACVLVACGACAEREVEELPPVRTPVGLRFACHPPENVPPLEPPPLPPGGSRCGEVSCIDEPLRVDGTQKGDSYSVVVRFDRDGTIIEAFVPEERSPEVDTCVLERLRKGWPSPLAPLKPARDCMGKRLDGDVALPYRLVFAAVSRPVPDDVDYGVTEFGRHICPDIAAARFWRPGASWSVIGCVDGRFLVTTDGEREGRMTREHDAALRRAALNVLRARDDPAASPRYWGAPYGDGSLNVCVRLAREPQFCVTLWEHEGKRNPDGGTVPAIAVARELASLVSPERVTELDQWLAGRTPPQEALDPAGPET